MNYIEYDEKKALRQVLEAGKIYGFGRCGQALSYAWAKRLMETEGFDEATALTGGIVHEAWNMQPKKLTRKQAKQLMEFGKQILSNIYE